MIKKQLKKITEATKGSLFREWCIVDVDNEFTFNGHKFRIAKDVKEYEVKNKPQYKNCNWNNWTNEAKMDKVLCVIGNEISFYDQNINSIKNTSITMVQ